MAFASHLKSTVSANPGLALGVIAALCLVLIAMVYRKFGFGGKSDGKSDGKPESKSEKLESKKSKKSVKFADDADPETEELISSIEKK